MNIIKVFPPVVSQFFVDVSQDATIDLQFSTSEADYQRDDNDVVITLADGSNIVLLNFFLANADQKLPLIKDEWGHEMDGGAFLHKFNPNIPLNVVVEPEQEDMPASSGLSAYNDDSGRVISGLELSDALAAAPADGPGSAFTFRQMEATPGQSGGPPPDQLSPNPPGPSTPQSGPYLARAVSYASSASASARFRLIDAHGRPVADSTAEAFSASSENGYFDVGSISFYPDGSISYSLSADGEAALAAAAGADIFDYITFQYGGREYTMQVLVNSSGNYSPADAEADGRPHPALDGEWHYADSVEAHGQKQGSAGNDGMWFYNAATPGTGTAFTGSLAFKAGNNSFSAEGGEYGVSDAEITAGSGADIIYIHGGAAGLHNSSVNTGAGPDSVKIASQEDAVYNSAQSSIIAHEGSVELSVSGASGQATGIYSSGAGATVDIEAPKISINIDADTGSALVGAYNAYGSQVSLNSGGGESSALSINLHNTNGAVYGLYAYANDNADGNAIKLENVTAQPGKALIDVNSEASSAYAVRNWKSEVALSGNPANAAQTLISAESGGTVAYTVYGAHGSTSISGFQNLHISADCENDIGWSAPLMSTGNDAVEGLGRMYLSDIDSLTLSSRCSGWAAYGINTNAYIELGSAGSQIGEIIIDARNSNAGARSNHAQGISNGSNGELHITAGRLDINAHAATGDAKGINAENGGRNFISSDCALDISINVSGPSTAANMGTAPNNLTYGIYADPNGNPRFASNNIIGGQAPGEADIITLTGGGVMAYRGGSNNIITGDGDDVLTLNSIEAIGRGMNSGYVRSYNNINMGAGDNTLKASISADNDAENNISFSGGGNNLIYGGDIKSGGSSFASKNHIYNEDAASSFNLTIGEAGTPLLISSGYRGDNIIDTAAADQADSITIHGSLEATNSYTYESYGNQILTSGGDDSISISGGLAASNSGINRIDSGADNDSISIGGSLSVSGRAQNIISAGVGDDNLFISGDVTASGAYYGASIYAHNSLDLGSGHDTLTINGRLEAITYGRNLINTGDGGDTLTINGGISAAGSGQNLIDTGSGDDTLIINGSIARAGSGKNAISTGEGDDVVILNGQVAAGALTLDMGAGNDLLVLEATDHTEFTSYYQSWLNTAVLNGVESLHVRMDNGGLGDLGWLVDYANDNGINLEMAPSASPFASPLSLGHEALLETLQSVDDGGGFMLGGSLDNAADWGAAPAGYDPLAETQLEILRLA